MTILTSKEQRALINIVKGKFVSMNMINSLIGKGILCDEFPFSPTPVGQGYLDNMEVRMETVKTVGDLL